MTPLCSANNARAVISLLALMNQIVAINGAEM